MESTSEVYEQRRSNREKDVFCYAAMIISYHLVIGCLLFMCYGSDVNEKHIGIHAKFLVLFTACIRVAVFIPYLMMMICLMKKRYISPYLYRLTYYFLLFLYFPWAVYLVIRFFADDNHTKNEAGFLYAALLFLMIEGMILIFFAVLFTLLALMICILLCYIHRRQTEIENQQAERNERIADFINTIDILNVTGGRFEANDICCICLENYSEENGPVIQIPCPGPHYFHKQCVIQWIREKNCCPICKAEITIEDINNAIAERQQKPQGSQDYGTIEREGLSESEEGKERSLPPPEGGRTAWRDT
ncbi:unnamed protein product [Moneuplotes crassus]|uniref:RING-type domain-containing protein n=1 Tax=Euplotes crassus TaxID=5936 RepID=A0AAD2CYX4_EUPCR|nr:unnamed protein product [Moneuplotes crassus]